MKKFAVGILILFIYAGAYTADFIVTNTNDSGAGSLRQAIADAEGNTGPDMITFSCTGTICITSQYNVGLSSGGISILGDTAHGIIIDGTNNNTAGALNCFRLYNNITLSGLVIVGSHSNGIFVYGNNNKVENCYIGVDSDGVTAHGNTEEGIYIYADSANNIIGGSPEKGNVISGNGQSGVKLWGVSNSNNEVSGNLIGTDHTGSTAVPNAIYGVNVQNFGTGNVLGGDIDLKPNVISGNDSYGIFLKSLINYPESISVIGNLIGTDITGTSAIPNGGCGIYLKQVTNFTVGSTVESERNVISGNPDGVIIYNCSNVSITGNYIGINIDGTAILGNTSNGIRIEQCTSGNTIGGSMDGAGNVIGGNTNGIYLTSTCTENYIAGNYIGTDRAATADLGNTGYGIYLYASHYNIIGGPGVFEKNLLSRNNMSAIELEFADYNTMSGNEILYNELSGIHLYYADYNIVGTSGAGNCISGNSTDGIHVDRSYGTIVKGNLIGTGTDGISKYGNGQYGINDDWSSLQTQIGGSAPGEGNVISGNGSDGIYNYGVSFIYGNFIGTDESGLLDLGNGGYGIQVRCSAVIGGRSAGEGNIIAYNALTGAGSHYTNDAMVVGNSFYGNGGLGIDFGDLGPEENDYGDNNSPTNYPEFTITRTGLNTFSIEIFNWRDVDVDMYFVSSATLGILDAADPSGYGEAYELFYSTTLAAGYVTIDDFNFPNDAVICMTATSASAENTSEFSYNRPMPGQIISVAAEAEDLPYYTKVGTGNLHFMTLTLTPSMPYDELTGMEFTLGGTAQEGDLERIVVYIDDGNGILAPETDTVAGTATFTADIAKILFQDIIFGESPILMFVVADIAADAQLDDEIAVSLTSSSSFEFKDPTTSATGSFPATSDRTVLMDYENTLDGLSVYPNPAVLGTGANAIRFNGLTRSAVIEIFDISGKKVFGTETFNDLYYDWNITDNNGERISSGIYVYCVKSGETRNVTGKISVIK